MTSPSGTSTEAMDVQSQLADSSHFSLSSKYPCLICGGLLTDDCVLFDEKDARAVEDTFAIFCNYMRWEGSKSCEPFDLEIEVFPFCGYCKCILENMCALNEQLNTVWKQIDKLVLSTNAKIILSNEEESIQSLSELPEIEMLEAATHISPIILASGNRPCYNRSKVQQYRDYTLNRFLPTVVPKRTDVSRVKTLNEPVKVREAKRDLPALIKFDNSSITFSKVDAPSTATVSSDEIKSSNLHQLTIGISSNGLGFQCAPCALVTRSKEELLIHIQTFHSGTSFKSNSSDYQKSQTSSTNGSKANIVDVGLRQQYNDPSIPPRNSHPAPININAFSNARKRIGGPRGSRVGASAAIRSRSLGVTGFRKRFSGENFCSTCNKRFSTRQALDTHLARGCKGYGRAKRIPSEFVIQIAANQFRYRGMTFTQLSSSEFQCDDCGYKAKLKNHISCHILKRHLKNLMPGTETDVIPGIQGSQRGELEISAEAWSNESLPGEDINTGMFLQQATLEVDSGQVTSGVSYISPTLPVQTTVESHLGEGNTGLMLHQDVNDSDLSCGPLYETADWQSYNQENNQLQIPRFSGFTIFESTIQSFNFKAENMEETEEYTLPSDEEEQDISGLLPSAAFM